MNDGEFIPSLIFLFIFPSRGKKKQRNSAVGVEFTFALHLPHVMLHHIWDYNSRSCQVIKVCIKVCCSLNMRPVIQGATVEIYSYAVARF